MFHTALYACVLADIRVSIVRISWIIASQAHVVTMLPAVK